LTYFRRRNLITSPKWCHSWYSWSFIPSRARLECDKIR